MNRATFGGTALVSAVALAIALLAYVPTYFGDFPLDMFAMLALPGAGVAFFIGLAGFYAGNRWLLAVPLLGIGVTYVLWSAGIASDEKPVAEGILMTLLAVQTVALSMAALKKVEIAG